MDRLGYIFIPRKPSAILNQVLSGTATVALSGNETQTACCTFSREDQRWIVWVTIIWFALANDRLAIITIHKSVKKIVPKRLKTVCLFSEAATVSIGIEIKILCSTFSLLEQRR